MGDDQSHPPCLNPAPFLWKDITILQKQPKSIRSILFLFRRMFFKDKTQYVDRVANTKVKKLREPIFLNINFSRIFALEIALKRLSLPCYRCKR